ncbi:MAG: insulinase family protein [Alphaproteobacteria bacterium]|jgi:predicted Zn-dependent peptidase|nr:insulinase family protein [Alphaproteobacteria bacterium]MBT5159109.1 insulinase family protein [Alphaproteobacteria bacterium]MBT5920310.1 insulinase family protein [Alphaproteobacteria bacterium]MBT6386182.1 insulinase family protein [Alphaproteobacteria bacterium]
MSVKITTLENGLRIATDPMADLQTAAVGVWVDVGARNEDAEQNGISHVLEHMAFKGTERRNALQIAEEIEAVGGHLNAYTSREQTAYFARILKDDLPLAVDILADILQHSTFATEELERERTVIIQEIGQTKDTPDDLVFEYFQQAAYPDQPLGRSILGTEEKVAGFARATLRDYMGSHYRGPGMVLAAAGGVDHDQLVDLATKAFDKLPSDRGHQLSKAQYQGGEHFEERSLEQVHYLMGFEGLAYDDDDFYAAQILATVLGGGMSSRLFQEIRERRGLAYSVFAFSSSYVDSGNFGVYAGTAQGDVEELVPVLCDEINRASQDINDQETSRARAQHKAGIMMGLEAAGARAEHLGRQLHVFGRVISPAELVEEIDKVDAAALRRVATRIIKTPLTVAALGPINKLEAQNVTAGRFR